VAPAHLCCHFDFYRCEDAFYEIEDAKLKAKLAGNYPPKAQNRAADQKRVRERGTGKEQKMRRRTL
jgi:ribosomal protein S30